MSNPEADSGVWEVAEVDGSIDLCRFEELLTLNGGEDMPGDDGCATSCSLYTTGGEEVEEAEAEEAEAEEEEEEAEAEEEEAEEEEAEEEDADDDCYDDGDENGGGSTRRAPRRRAIASPEYRRIDMGLRARVKFPTPIGKRAPKWQTEEELEAEEY